ncbi:MAG: hypothetical protein K5765_09480 [Clostridia bacterium]|nr:hypothetical protein [Clostridia bacterium]
MRKDPYLILGISKEATLDEAYAAYKAARDRYESLRFEPGEVGSDACIKLQEIDEAYDIVSDEIKQRDSISHSNENNSFDPNSQRSQIDDLTKIERASSLIKEGKTDEAQAFLDDCSVRPAKWHYVQSAIFYQKGWKADAMRQLDLACDMDPNNPTFREAKRKMEESMNANTTDKQKSYYNENTGNENQRSYREAPAGGTGRGCGVCDVCCGLLCCDSCCECMGGDLIPCC